MELLNRPTTRYRKRRLGLATEHWACDCSLFGSTKMYRQTILALFTWFLNVSFLAAQGKLAKLPSSPADAGASCNRVGEVLGRDVFAQTFLLKQDDGQMETV